MARLVEKPNPPPFFEDVAEVLGSKDEFLRPNCRIATVDWDQTPCARIKNQAECRRQDEPPHRSFLREMIARGVLQSHAGQWSSAERKLLCAISLQCYHCPAAPGCTAELGCSAAHKGGVRPRPAGWYVLTGPPGGPCGPPPTAGLSLPFPYRV